MESYIGVTGFMSRAEVNAALAVLDHLERDGEWSGRLLMTGVLVSSKTLAGGTNKYPNRYPPIDKVASIFPPDRRTLNLIHYATDAWPDPVLLETFVQEHDVRIVLQIGSQAIEECESDPKKIAERLVYYEGVITHALLDLSGGKGLSMDTDKMRSLIDIVDGLDFSIGVAGGLAAGALDPIKPLMAMRPNLSVDAEGRLRNPENDQLDLQKMTDYLREADALFRKGER